MNEPNYHPKLSSKFPLSFRFRPLRVCFMANSEGSIAAPEQASKEEEGEQEEEGVRARRDCEQRSAAMASSSERRGIPAATFVKDVQEFLVQYDGNPGTCLTALQERLQQYKLAEMKLLGQKRDLLAKIPDIRKCLQVVDLMMAKKGSEEPLKMDFEVAEGIYAQAEFQDTETVCLWLGANVMLEYGCEEAKDLLTRNLDTANKSLKSIVEDLHFLRDQMTITEVTIARVYNWDVHQRRKQRAIRPEADTAVA